MASENAVLMSQARQSLQGKWGLAIGTFIVYFLIVGASNGIPFLGNVGSLILGGPMAVGMAIFSLHLGRNQEAKLEQIFEGFKNFGNALGAYILMVIFIFLWTLLLVVPGIIAAISYSQTFYIIAEDSSIGPMDALRKSREMMDGYKWKYFEMGLVFFGLSLLCILTLGIGFLWLIPYANVSYANFYDDIKGEFSLDVNMIDEDILDNDLV
ncbi:MAG: DUF975 family protein [Saprospiraceae bacterium]|nr:DUF975 family protein [Saprospiraceae bacterium]MCB9322822.1 DUF975 family protein [Lewinellaceae bacterium]